MIYTEPCRRHRRRTGKFDDLLSIDVGQDRARSIRLGPAAAMSPRVFPYHPAPVVIFYTVMTTTMRRAELMTIGRETTNRGARQ